MLGGSGASASPRSSCHPQPLCSGHPVLPGPLRPSVASAGPHTLPASEASEGAPRGQPGFTWATQGPSEDWKLLAAGPLPLGGCTDSRAFRWGGLAHKQPVTHERRQSAPPHVVELPSASPASTLCLQMKVSENEAPTATHAPPPCLGRRPPRVLPQLLTRMRSAPEAAAVASAWGRRRPHPQDRVPSAPDIITGNPGAAPVLPQQRAG